MKLLAFMSLMLVAVLFAAARLAESSREARLSGVLRALPILTAALFTLGFWLLASNMEHPIDP